MPKDENLKTGNKILWKRGEIFHNIFNKSQISRVQLHIHLLNVVVQFIFSSILQFLYVEVRISRSISERPVDFEITRVDCIWRLLCFRHLSECNFLCMALYSELNLQIYVMIQCTIFCCNYVCTKYFILFRSFYAPAIFKGGI